MVNERESYFQTLKSLRDERRKSEPEPEFRMGMFTPQVTVGQTLLGVGVGWEPMTILNRAVTIWARTAMPAILRGADELGWEKWILTLDQRQGETVTNAGKAFRKELGVTGNTLNDVLIVAAAGTSGCGFNWHRIAEFDAARNRVYGVGNGCPMINAARDMGVEDKCKQQSIWCDLYDYFETRASNPEIWYTHGFCLGRGDPMCGFVIHYEKRKPGENLYQSLKRIQDEKRAEIGDVTKYFVPGYRRPRVAEKWSQQELLEMGVRIWRRIAVASIIIGADSVGWEKVINGMNKVEGPRLTEITKNTAVKYGITGTTALDASLLMSLGMLGCGFDDHQVIHWTPKRVEGVARTCPIIESAKELKLADRLGEISLWCDAYRNFEVHGANEKFWVTHTHCLGRGDKLCRWVIDDK